MVESESLSAYGRVERIDNQAFAYIRTQRQTSCGGCQAGDSCGTGILSRLFSAQSRTLLKVVNDLNARPGDQVELILPGGELLKQTLWAYGSPLLGLFAGAATANGLWPGAAEWVTLLTAFFGMAVAWWWLPRMMKPVMPKMVRIVARALQS